MRIRRRALPSLSPSPLPASALSDPPDLHHPPSAGSEARAAPSQGLHPDGDLPSRARVSGEEPTRSAPRAPATPDPPTHLPGRCIPPPNPTHVQVIQGKEEEEEEEELQQAAAAVDSRRWEAQVNSNKRPAGSSSGAKKTMGGHGSDDGSWGSEEEPMCKERAVTKPKPKANAGYTRVGYVDKENGAVNGNTGGKKRRSPAVLMEGSRCSRVNGRGWRCCQPTLVGYSLCEHHLGKGRLRSMNSVRGQLGTSKLGGASALQAQQQKPAHDGPSVQVDQEKEEAAALKKRKKIGTVKARSISSLLDKTEMSTTSLPPTATPPPLLPPLSQNHATV